MMKHVRAISKYKERVLEEEIKFYDMVENAYLIGLQNYFKGKMSMIIIKKNLAGEE